MKKAGIIGAGITGLTTAFRLMREGYEVTVWEASPIAGGAIQSHRDGGWLAEAGPNSIQDSDAAVGELVTALGLETRLLEASTEAKRRYIVRNRKPVLVPSSPLSAIRTPLFSWKAKLGVLGEPFRAAASTPDESLADFVRRRLGQEFLDYAINPMVGGIFAGNPESLSVTHAFPKVKALEDEFGSLIKGAIGRARQRKQSGTPPHRKRVLSFPDGLSELTQALATHLGNRLHLGHAVTHIRRDTSGLYYVTTASDVPISPTEESSAGTKLHTALTIPTTSTGTTSTISTATAEACFDRLIFAGTLPALEHIQIDGLNGLPDSNLTTLTYAPAISITTGFDRDQVAHPLDGFGVLVPEVERMNILGTLFTSSIFPHRAPEHGVTLTTFVGGMRSSELTTLDDETLLKVVLEDLDTLLDIHGKPQFVHITRWPKAIPQYEMGFEQYLQRMAEIEAANPGFQFAGNYRTGISLDACIRHAWKPS
jgi:protoporphyrinogen/coproporphyrinogen III oxidase